MIAMMIIIMLAMKMVIMIMMIIVFVQGDQKRGRKPGSQDKKDRNV